MKPELASLALADPPERWRALGFTVVDGACSIGGVTLLLGAAGEGISGWAVSGVQEPVDGLPVIEARPPSPALEHPNGAIEIDHVVVISPDFERTANALEQAGMPLRRVREVPGRDGGRAFRQGFRRLGTAILELVEAPGASPGPARFWGLVITVSDLDALSERLGEHLGSAREAVQPGRRIATLRSTAGLGEAVAFMSAEPLR
jgi:hypothetical protein